MDDKYFSEIEARERAATPGPWYNFGNWIVHTESDVSRNGIPSEKMIGTFKHKDADFIAHSRADISALIDVHKQDQQQITLLTDILDLVCRNACGEAKSNWDMIGCPPNLKEKCKTGNQGECHECWKNYFTEQVKALMSASAPSCDNSQPEKVTTE